MMKRIYLSKSFLLSLAVISALITLVVLPAKPALAGPPAPLTFTVTQPDGVTRFEARAWGNEFSNGTETVDGYTILQNPNTNYWFYAEVDSSGLLVATNNIVGQDPPPASAFHARPVTATVAFYSSQIVAQGPVGVASVPTLVVLTQFADQAPVGSTETDWVDKFFGTSNSVKHYYEEISYNQFTLTPAAETCGTANNGIVDWVNTGTPHPGSDFNNSETLTQNALTAADGCVNYATYDSNGDNIIDPNELLVIIIAAGYEESYAGKDASLTPNVWAHQWFYSGGPPLDGMTGFSYAQFGEWHGSVSDDPGHLATIGVMVHEVGHLLGWPDLYDIDESSLGVGQWSVMGYGSWNGLNDDGDSPAHPSAWEKWYQGWLNPITVTTGDTPTNIPQVETNRDNAVIQLLDNPNGVDWSFGDNSGSGEYFLVENRQQTGYDTALPGCGLLIWHIDESRTSTNDANADESHKLVDLEEADGNNELDNNASRGDAGDPYPGSSGNTSFSNTSNPNSHFYSDLVSNVSVTNISTGCTDPMTATFGQSATVCADPVIPPGATIGFCHQVQPIDTLFSLGRQYGVDPYLISWLNQLYSPNLIYDDQSLFIPATNEAGDGPNVYLVNAGDTLASIADQCRLSVSSLARANGLDPTAVLTECQALTIPIRPYPPPFISYPDSFCPIPPPHCYYCGW